ncbi:RING-14 protein [Tothia fuscella]|uniref:RING-14 protein n=1 Tax=Tothia fuscella TaxID=1048955 RepID=A0A9P4NQV9_9PEZI|nr:RING-14 protein [Tothia fuscella]
MKFGHLYRDRLREAGFPPEWINTAINYNQLKKCIKRVRQELASLGLDAVTLQRLLKNAEKASEAAEKGQHSDEEGDERPLRYEFAGMNGPAKSAGPIVPKLLILVDEETGQPIDASLAPETKDYIHQLALKEQLTNIHITARDDNETASPPLELSKTHSNASDSGRKPSRPHRLIEVPLTNDSVFFNMLQSELFELASLQEAEKQKLYSNITEVGKTLARVTEPDGSKATKDLAHWRNLFELYINSRVFFATTEQDHGAQKFAEAQRRFKLFLEQASKMRFLGKFKRKASGEALQQFLHINTELLQNLRFHEMNQTAMNKILKKFDKRTALGVKATFPTRLPPSMLSENIAKSLSAQVATDIISIVPQLDDYLCPICSELAWRPVRLRCQHVYCIRCLVILQRDGTTRCPLCRDNVVMQADARHIDEEMIVFLKKYFSTEVKQKQKLNERAAFVDKYGENYDDTQCTVM